MMISHSTSWTYDRSQAVDRLSKGVEGAGRKKFWDQRIPSLPSIFFWRALSDWMLVFRECLMFFGGFQVINFPKDNEFFISFYDICLASVYITVILQSFCLVDMTWMCFFSMLFCELFFFEKDLSFNDWPIFFGRGKMFSGSFVWRVGGYIYICIR